VRVNKLFHAHGRQTIVRPPGRNRGWSYGVSNRTAEPHRSGSAGLTRDVGNPAPACRFTHSSKRTTASRWLPAQKKHTAGPGKGSASR
jgi:hypothetical protein